jgi:probable rRNA maturation factor
MSHVILNRQRKVKVAIATFEKFLAKAFEAIGEADRRSATIVFVSDEKMRILNLSFRKKNATTDVLSFPFEDDGFGGGDEPSLGDIVISVEQAARQAKSNRMKLDRELKQLMLHGLLHLCGYDHETDNGEMNRRELRLREELGI